MLSKINMEIKQHSGHINAFDLLKCGSYLRSPLDVLGFGFLAVFEARSVVKMPPILDFSLIM